MKPKFNIRHFLFGNPLRRNAASEQKLTKKKALAIFSSDALSSVAYASDEILTALVVAGAAALAYLMHIALFIGILIIIVGISYRQTIRAYPNGGGAYAVARDNLGPWSALVAAAALMIDYILTVSVSVSAGVFAITSAFPSLAAHAVALSVLTVLFVTWMNLRGLRESASFFALPTYLFIGFILVLVGTGLFRYWQGTLTPLHYAANADMLTSQGAMLTTLILLRAFSSGCTAMTGIEAVANGVQAFKSPSDTNAVKTMGYLITLLLIMFIGISMLAQVLELRPLVNESLISQLGHVVFGNGLLYYGLQITTCLILLLAANTSFAGFPLLASVIARDGFLPRPLSNLGDRLAFSNGILLLAVIAIMLIILFRAQVDALIPLYAIGVFLAFTLSQAGLVRVWYKRRDRYWQVKAFINGFGCLCTAVALIVIIDSKFTEGAWIVLLILPLLLWLFHTISKHYTHTDAELAHSVSQQLIDLSWQTTRAKVVVPVSKLHKGTIAALSFAHSLSDDVIAVHVDTESDKTLLLKQEWEKYTLPIPLLILESPYQSSTQPLLDYIKVRDDTEPERGLTVIVVPKALPAKAWHYLLHNQKTILLRAGLSALSRQYDQGKTRVFVEVPYQLR